MALPGSIQPVQSGRRSWRMPRTELWQEQTVVDVVDADEDEVDVVVEGQELEVATW